MKENYFWGTPDSSVSFCETKYTKVLWIAEYYNTITSLAYIPVALFFLKTSLNKQAKCLIFVGLGATILHGTLRKYGQWLDELSMLYLAFYTLQKIRPKWNITKNIMLIPITGGYVLFHSNFLYFLTIFAGIQIVIAYETAIKHNKFKNYKSFITLYLISLGAGTFCWTLDQVACQWVQQYQLHAVWHICTAFATFFGYMALLANEYPKVV